MNEYKYIIIGGGMTGSAAVQGIRKMMMRGQLQCSLRSNLVPIIDPR